jgi:hypothetical protein
MLISHKGRGVAHGSGGAAAKYITQERDAKGRRRDEVRILEGDPALVGTLADSLDFKYTYTSGVIAWREDEQPTEKQLQAVLADYKRVAFAGLESDQYSFAAVLHREAEAVHIHTLTARVELTTGKSLNIAPPGHQRTFDAVRNYHNELNAWISPDDPCRQRSVRLPNHLEKINAQNLREGMRVAPDHRQVVTDYLSKLIEDGLINDRDDILTTLAGAGFETPRAGKNYITIKDPDTGGKWRLKGAIYNADFQCSELARQAESETRERPAADRKIDKRALRSARDRLQSEVNRRIEYNRQRYQRPQHSNQRGVEQDRGAEVAPHVDLGVDRVPDLGSYLRRHLGYSAILVNSDREAVAGGERIERSINGVKKQGREDSVQRLRPEKKDVRQGQQGSMVGRKQGPVDGSRGVLINDRDRTIAIEAIERADRSKRAVIDAAQRLGRAGRGLAEATKGVVGLERAVEWTGNVLQRAKQTYREFVKHIDPIQEIIEKKEKLIAEGKEKVPLVKKRSKGNGFGR